MATETEAIERRSAHVRSITVTSVATLAGVAAGLVSSAVATGATDVVGVGVVATFAFAGLAVMQALGIDVPDFSTKDNLYVFFMTFALWFITWSILLTSDVSL